MLTEYFYRFNHIIENKSYRSERINLMTYNFRDHYDLLGKYGIRLFFSKSLREVLLQEIPSVVIAVFVCLQFDDYLKQDENLSIFIFYLNYLFFLLFFILATNTYIINSLSRISYKNFSIKFLKNDTLVDKLDFYHALRLKLSFIWRRFVIYGVIVFLVFGLEFVPPSETMDKLFDGTSYTIVLTEALGTFYWTMLQKKKGCLLVFQPK
jgi:hypothetical protein